MSNKCGGGVVLFGPSRHGGKGQSHAVAVTTPVGRRPVGRRWIERLAPASVWRRPGATSIVRLCLVARKGT